MTAVTAVVSWSEAKAKGAKRYFNLLVTPGTNSTNDLTVITANTLMSRPEQTPIKNSMLADTVHAPGAAPANNDMPTYLYLCGGRGAPWRNVTTLPILGTLSGYAPVIFLESTTVPDSLGYPKADLAYAGVTFPRAACCYIGVKFRAAGGTANVPAFYNGDWIYSQGEVLTNLIGFAEAGITATTPILLTLASAPAVSTMALLSGNITVGTGSASVSSAAGGIWISGDASISRRMTPDSATVCLSGLTVSVSLTGGTTFVPIPMAYDMNIPRLAR